MGNKNGVVIDYPDKGSTPEGVLGKSSELVEVHLFSCAKNRLIGKAKCSDDYCQMYYTALNSLFEEVGWA